MGTAGYDPYDDLAFCPVSAARMADVEIEVEAEERCRARLKDLRAQVGRLAAENRQLQARLDGVLDQIADLRQQMPQTA
jgi:predicted RNase H-like nuclease (RuvC/YqgF family)